MQNEFIPYEQALELKELGFDEHCFMSYNPNSNFWDNYCTNSQISSLNGNNSIVCSAPLYQQAFRWFREKYGLVMVIKPIDDKRLELGYNITKNGLIIKACTTYEEAELACLKKLIEVVNTNS